MRVAMIAAAVLAVFSLSRAADGQWFYSSSGGAYPAYPNTQSQIGGSPGESSYAYGGVPVGQLSGSSPVGASYGGYWGSAYYGGYPYQRYYRAYLPQQSIYPRSYTVVAPPSTSGIPDNVAAAPTRAPNPVYGNFSHFTQGGYRRFGSGRTAGTYAPRVYTIYQPRSGGLFGR